MGRTSECAGSRGSARRRQAAVEDCREKAERVPPMSAVLVVENQPPSSQNKSRSESKRTPQMLAAICKLVKTGLSVSHAAEKLHVHHTTVGRWRKELPEFDAAILAAEAEFIESQIANIRRAAKTSWQASGLAIGTQMASVLQPATGSIEYAERKDSVRRLRIVTKDVARVARSNAGSANR